jgi:predicted ATP-grasp superfamily ATP-dependent carboligase
MNNVSFTTNSFKKNVKWFRLLTDAPTVISEVLKGRLTLTDYFNSISGKKQFAVYSSRDPVPFFVEVLLAPYFWYKRGF